MEILFYRFRRYTEYRATDYRDYQSMEQRSIYVSISIFALYIFVFNSICVCKTHVCLFTGDERKQKALNYPSCLRLVLSGICVQVAFISHNIFVVCLFCWWCCYCCRSFVVFAMSTYFACFCYGFFLPLFHISFDFAIFFFFFS